MHSPLPTHFWRVKFKALNGPQLITIYTPEKQNLRLALDDQPQNPIQTETQARTRTQALVANHFHRMHVCCEKKKN